MKKYKVTVKPFEKSDKCNFTVSVIALSQSDAENQVRSLMLNQMAFTAIPMDTNTDSIKNIFNELIGDYPFNPFH